MEESAFFQVVAAEASVSQARKDVLRALRVRFGETAAREFEDAVNHLVHLEQLDALLEIASQSRRISQFRRAIEGL